ncbi:ABC transporter permease [Caballeronia mineralivorans]|jgi:putative spermidine/putrescine transport system permease protein|uniref:ABC transporter permease n=1 Tax=Caballeronia mineralivorans TaxID=2010198 RepID=UPI0023F29B9C|nr:ABC transporter permease [Caballeronia mineralivorans]MDB5785138.1 transporter permease [Caballeronia mineralivorans]
MSSVVRTRVPGSRRIAGDWLLTLPLSVFFLAFVAVPLALLAAISLHNDAAMTHAGLHQYARFFSDSYNRGILWSTLGLGVWTTVSCIVLGYPVAWLYVSSSARWRRPLLLCILLPLLTSSVVRTFAWVVILGNEGLVNQVLAALGLIGSPVKLLYTPTAVVLSLAQIELPLMVLPLATALSAIDPRLSEASHALGASPWRTWWQVTLPLSVPGLLSGTLLVFTGAVSAFVVQTLVGGGQLMYMPFYIYQQAIQSQDYPFAAAIAMILLVSILVMVTLLNYGGRKTKGFVHG